MWKVVNLEVDIHLSNFTQDLNVHLDKSINPKINQDHLNKNLLPEDKNVNQEIEDQDLNNKHNLKEFLQENLNNLNQHNPNEKYLTIHLRQTHNPNNNLNPIIKDNLQLEKELNQDLSLEELLNQDHKGVREKFQVSQVDRQDNLFNNQFHNLVKFNNLSLLNQ